MKVGKVWVRRGEIWIGTLGLFWAPFIGIELPSGRVIAL